MDENVLRFVKRGRAVSGGQLFACIFNSLRCKRMALILRLDLECACRQLVAVDEVGTCEGLPAVACTCGLLHLLAL